MGETEIYVEWYDCNGYENSRMMSMSQYLTLTDGEYDVTEIITVKEYSLVRTIKEN